MLKPDERSEELPLPADDVGRRAARGGVVTGVAQAAKALLDAGGSLFLARTLSPADFGFVDMIVSVTGVIDLLKDFGLSTATIQRESINHAQVNALFWVNLAIGVVLTAITAACAPLLAVGYGQPELLELTLALSLSTLLGSLSIQHQALLRRNLRFERVAVVDVVSALVATALAIVAAYRGVGAWALVTRQLTRLSVQALLTWLLSPWRPSRPRPAAVRDLLRFGTHLSGFQVMNYLERNLDNVLVGRFAGADALGFYTRAYDLMRLPINQINGPIGTVAVPALCRLAGDADRYRSAYCSLTRLLLLATIPLAPLSILTAPWFIPAVLGDHWTGSVAIFQWLAVGLLLKPLLNTTGWLFISQGRTREMLNWGVMGSVIAGISFVVGLPWGALGVAISYTLTDLFVRAPILLRLAGHTGPVSTRDMLSCLGAGMTCALFVSVGFLVVEAQCEGLSEAGRAGAGTAGALIMGLVSVLATPWGRGALRDGRRMLAALRSKQPTSAS